MRITLICILSTITNFSAAVLTNSAFISPGRHRQTSEYTVIKSKATSERDELDFGDHCRDKVRPGRMHVMTARTARIEKPLAALFGSSSLLMTPSQATAAQGSFQVFEKTMKKYFPTALPTAVISTKVRSVLSSRKFSRTNTLFGTCISPDEINSKPDESLSPVLEDYLSKHKGTYALGGIGGLPLQGVRGMKEYLSHCPRGGKVFVLFGPNIGISDNGTLGYIERLGQRGLSECCEPGIKTFDTIQAQIQGQTSSGASSKEYDYALDGQMEFIMNNLQKYVDTPKATQVSKSAIPVFMTLQMFKLGQSMIMDQLEACLEDQAKREGIQEIVLLGGIIVNRGQVLGSIEPREDYFQPLLFRSYNGEADITEKLEEPTDLYEEAFGNLPSFSEVFS